MGGRQQTQVQKGNGIRECFLEEVPHAPSPKG